MAKHTERPPLRIRPGPSRRLALLLLISHGTACVLVLALPVPGYAQAALLLTILASLGYQIGAHLLRRLPWAVREAVWDADGTWTLLEVSGQQFEARLAPATYVTTALVVLSFRCTRWRFCSMVLLPDALDTDLLRRLRVRLRLASDSGSREI